MILILSYSFEMKKSFAKNKKDVKNNLKISQFFSKITPNKPCSNGKPSSLKVEETNDVLEVITNLPKNKSSDVCPSTPPFKKRKYSRENSLSPDYIPCSLSKKELQKCSGVIKLPCLKPVIINETPIEISPPTSPHGTNYLSCIPTEQLTGKPAVSTSSFMVTPEKNNKLSKSNSAQKKLTPSKLFSKSPKKLHEFNVKIIEDFIKVTPSKSNYIILSPTSSNRSFEVQQSNEKTPTKREPQGSRRASAQVKMKLDFSFETEAKDAPIGEKNCSMECLLNDSWGADDIMETEIHVLDLSQSHLCKIVKIDKTLRQVELTLESVCNKSTAECIVEGFWAHNMKLALSDVIHVTAFYDRSLSKWRVTSENGLIVFEPNFLMSSTSVVGALFCKRRSVLSERFRGFEPSNRVMIIGILVHKLLQEVLKRNVTTYEAIDAIVSELLADKDTVWSCYESCLEIEDIRKELQTFVPKIVTFMANYVGPKSNQAKLSKDNWAGKIDRIQDIEENIWCPELGIKGKIDVSIQTGALTMPLELKTSKATMSLEHRGQVMLYVMMMKKFGYNVSSGLLLYLREGVLREIPIKKQEQRDLILLRNELTYYLTRKPQINGKLSHPELPEPINHHSACAKCPYNTICCAFLKSEGTNLAGNPLKDIGELILIHLSQSHLDYFIKWSSMLALEASHPVGNKQMQDIYMLSPAEREKRGQTIVSVKIVNVVNFEGLYKHTFEKIDGEESTNLLTAGMDIGSYVVVSINSRPAVSSGFVTAIEFKSITISLDRDLNKRYDKETFHLDSYSSSTSQTFNLTNLALLLEDSDRSEKLRKIIIEQQLPTFNTTLPKSVATKGTPILRTLNKLQQKAVLKSLSTNDYLLIKGMPGTGKTATIVSLVQILVQLNKSILITSHTHAAVDNVCLKLKDHNIDVLRLGNISRINPGLHSSSEEVQTQHCSTSEELQKVYNSAKVLAVTCLGSGHAVLSKRQLDVCIIDESTQVLQTSLVRTLYAAHKFILIGDPNQLPPIVRNQEAIELGLGQSLFERLDKPQATVTLSLNYRMNSRITHMANVLTYEGQLETANESVANATLCINQEKLRESCSSCPWIIDVLDGSLEASVRLLDTGAVNSIKEDDAHGCANTHETAIVFALVEALLLNEVPSSCIGIIAPYRAQVAQISRKLQNFGVTVSTVDQFQGQDKEVIIYTCTKSNTGLESHSKFEILEDKRRLTVAITRAKHKFILIGDLKTIEKYSPFGKLLANLPKEYFQKVEDGQRGFSWSELIQQVA